MANGVCCDPCDVDSCSRSEFCFNYYLHMIHTHSNKLVEEHKMMSCEIHKLQSRLIFSDQENDKMREQIIQLNKINDFLRMKRFNQRSSEITAPWPRAPYPLVTSTPAGQSPRVIKEYTTRATGEKSCVLLPLVISTPAKKHNFKMMSFDKENNTKKQAKISSFMQNNTKKSPDKAACEPTSINKSVDFGSAFSGLSLVSKKKVEFKKEPKVESLDIDKESEHQSSRAIQNARNRFKVKRKLDSAFEYKKSRSKSPVKELDPKPFDETMEHSIMHDEAVGGAIMSESVVCVTNTPKEIINVDETFAERESILQDEKNNTFLSKITKCSSDYVSKKATIEQKSENMEYLEVSMERIANKKMLPQTPEGFWNPFFSPSQQ